MSKSRFKARYFATIGFNMEGNDSKPLTEDQMDLRRAVIFQQPLAIEVLLNKDIDFRFTDENGNTVLHMAFENNVTYDNQTLIKRILKMFLSRDMDPNVMNNQGKTVLHLAIKFRLTQVITFLLDRGANLNICDADGDSIAHFVVDHEFDNYCECCWSTDYSHDRHENVKTASKHFIYLLLSRGLNVTLQNKNGVTPLQLAARYNLQHILLQLLEYRACNCTHYVDNNHQNIFHSLFGSLTQTKHVGLKDEEKPVGVPFTYDQSIIKKIIVLLLRGGCSVDKVDIYGDTPLHLAVKLLTPELSKMLLDRFSNVNACDKYGNTVLHTILQNTCNQNLHIYDEHMRMLLAKGTNIHKKNNAGLVPLQIAILQHYTDIMERFYNYGANFHVLHDDGDLLHLLVINSCSDMSKQSCKYVIDFLVSRGCNVNSRNKNGITVLQLAFRSSNNVDIIDRLLEHGADFTAVELSREKYTTLHLAVMKSYEKYVNMFLKAKLDVNARDANGQTPLHLATNDSNILRSLLNAGAHVDKYDYKGNTPIHMALNSENSMCVSTLLRYGADINDVNTIREIRYLIYRDKIGVLMIQHLLKLKIAHLPIISAFEDCIENFCKSMDVYGNVDRFSFQTLRFTYKTEVDKMKKHKIANHQMTWYDFLHMNPNRRCVFIRGTSVKKEINKISLPNYETVIWNFYRQAQARKSLLEKSVDAWYQITNIYLPDICVETIFSYLTNANLRNIVDSLQNE